MHYTDHALLSARKFGGNPEDYIKLHKIMDSSKYFYPNFMHRMFSHNLWFIQVLDELLGPTIKNSDGKDVSVRDILYEHLREDHNGKTPSLQDWLSCIKIENFASWINKPDPKELFWLEKQKSSQTQQTTTL